MRRKAGTGSIERAAKGGWRVRVRVADGTRRSLGIYPTPEEAELMLDASRGELQRADYLSAGGATLLAYGKHVLDRRERDGYRSVDSERSRLGAYVEPWVCAAWPLTAVTKGDVRRWLEGLSSKGLAPQTRRNALQVLRSIFRAAHDDGAIDIDPTSDLRVRDHGSTEEKSTWLTRHELDALLEAADDDGRATVAFAAASGLRQGEHRALRVEDVKLSAPDGAHVIVRYGRPKKATKSGKIRRVFLVPLAEAALRAALELRPKDHELVFPSARGEARQKGRMVHPESWATWMKEAGIGRDVRWHDLRHTCATLLLRGDLDTAPWSLEAVREQLGHSTVRVTERYAAATGGLAQAAAVRSPTKPTGPTTTQRIPMQLPRRGSDSNRRMTVLQSRDTSKCSAALHAAEGFARATLVALGGQDPRALAKLPAMAGEVLEAVETAKHELAGGGELVGKRSA